MLVVAVGYGEELREIHILSVVGDCIKEM